MPHPGHAVPAVDVVFLSTSSPMSRTGRTCSGGTHDAARSSEAVRVRPIRREGFAAHVWHSLTTPLPQRRCHGRACRNDGAKRNGPDHGKTFLKLNVGGLLFGTVARNLLTARPSDSVPRSILLL